MHEFIVIEIRFVIFLQMREKVALLWIRFFIGNFFVRNR